MGRPRKTPLSLYEQVAMPNAGSPHQTPASLNVDLRYAELGLYTRWTWDRFTRLAAFCRLTPYELASVVGMRHAQVDQLEKCNQLKSGTARDGCAAFALTLFEAHACAAYTSDVIENLIPPINMSDTPDARPENPR